ncbi:MAG TPA: reverse transcriptase domain-containing protein, partial [Bacteroidia bacterium]|nr:reverse transcriptase domain-containing protein [Bacteroidia bacterium]
ITQNGHYQSTPTSPLLGTPQGTSLSPTLFKIFVNSLLRASSFYPICFADDIILLAQIEPHKHQEDINRITMELPKVTKWYEMHRLGINTIKTISNEHY